MRKPALVTLAILAFIVGIGTIFAPVVKAQITTLGAQAVRIVFDTASLGSFRITPYLKSYNVTTTGTATLKTSVGVFGCVTIGKAGASGSLIYLYNGPAAAQSTSNLMATIDGALTGQFCYGMIANHGGGMSINVTSGSTVPLAVVTFR